MKTFNKIVNALVLGYLIGMPLFYTETEWNLKRFTSWLLVLSFYVIDEIKNTTEE